MRSRPAAAGPTRTTQVDLNYTQTIPVQGRLNLQLVADVFNVIDNQTGYNIEPRVHSAGSCHAEGWVQRPVTRDGRVKLVEFGLVKAPAHERRREPHVDCAARAARDDHRPSTLRAGYRDRDVDRDPS